MLPSNFQGVITTIQPLDYEDRTLHVMSVIAQDSGPMGFQHTNFATVRVNVHEGRQLKQQCLTFLFRYFVLACFVLSSLSLSLSLPPSPSLLIPLSLPPLSLPLSLFSPYSLFLSHTNILSISRLLLM